MRNAKTVIATSMHNPNRFLFNCMNSSSSLRILLLMDSMRRKTRVGSRSIVRNSFVLSIPNSLVSPTAVAVADRGSRSKRAISPKISPFSSTAMGISPPGVFFVILTRPDWITYIRSPSSPS